MKFSLKARVNEAEPENPQSKAISVMDFFGKLTNCMAALYPDSLDELVQGLTHHGPKYGMIEEIEKLFY